MNDVLDAIKARFRSPILGYLILTSAAINWKAIFYLVVDTGSVASRIEYFDLHTTRMTLLWIPAAISIAIAVTGPWARYFFAICASKPVHLYDILGVRDEHKVLIERKKLEDVRTKLLASAESELIDRAARDQMVEALPNEEARDKLRAEIAQLREERDALNSLRDQPSALNLVLSEEALELLTAAAAGKGTIAHREYLSGTQIGASGKKFIEAGSSAREIARWEGAIRELERLDLIEDKAGKGDLYFVTKAGYELMDKSLKQ